MKNIQQIDSNLQLISKQCIKINIDVKDLKILIANLTDIVRDYIKMKELTAPPIQPIKQTLHTVEPKQNSKGQTNRVESSEFQSQFQSIKTMFKEQVQSQIKKNNDQIQKTQRQMEGWKQKIQKYFVTKTHNLEQKIYIIEQSIRNDIVVIGEPLVIGDKDKDNKDKEKSTDNRNSLHVEKFQDKSWFDKFFATKKQKDFSLKQWLDEDSFYIPNLIQIGDTITTKDFSYLFSKKRLTGQSSYTVTFSKIGWRVALGVIGSQNNKKSSLSAFNQNSIWCWNDGDLYVSGKLSMKGKGFSIGEPITVIVNTFSGIIQWKVVTDARHIAYSQLLTNQFVNWVPFIYLYSKMDSVIISG